MERKKSMDNTVELKDLVYAPLQAISAANIRLSSNIVDFLASTGDLNTDSTGKPVVQLRTIQMMYEQLRSDAMENTVADSIGLEIPLLSIYPLSSLKVSKTKVSFDAEIKNMKVTDDDVKIYTQVCSKKQRDGANLPRFSYEVELDSAPISEGLARFIDTLNAQAIPKRIHSKPVDNSGKKLSGKELEDYERQMQYKEKEAELNARLSEVKEMIRTRNNSLKLETGMDFDEYKAHLEHLRSMGEDVLEPETYKSIEEYQSISVDLEVQLDDLHRSMVMDKVQEQESGKGGAPNVRAPRQIQAEPPPACEPLQPAPETPPETPPRTDNHHGGPNERQWR